MIRSEISLNTSELCSEKFLLFAASAPQTVSSSVGKQISSRRPAVQLNCLIGHTEVNNHTSANVHKYRANLQSHSRPLIFTSPQIVTSGNIIKNEYAPTIFLGKGNNCKSMFKTEITQCVVRLYYITYIGFLLSRRLMLELKAEVQYLRRRSLERRCNSSESYVNICQCENCLK